MCGIAGYSDFSNTTERHVVDEMISQIVYRGPDSYGTYHDPSNITGLGVRRLKIIDLTTGDQPIHNEDKSLTIVFNGEIYNYKELKGDLIKKGYKFRTESDTEVIVHLYQEYGAKSVEKLNGMFAFAIWDDKKKQLFLARDRAGIKPLYYFRYKQSLVFASELKSILAHPKYKKSIDQGALSLFGYFGYVGGDNSIFAGIKKLLPGHFIIFDGKNISIKKYFELGKEEEIGNATLDELLASVVKLQLNADVPVGVFLSGGLDSSLIAYYVSKYKRLKSFSIGFLEKGYDESPYAKYVSKALGTKHYNETFKANDVISIFSEITKYLDEPLADASLLPTYKVSQLARSHVTVALSGDGGDELFGGYPTYQAHIMSKYLVNLPKPVVDLFITTLNQMPEKLINLAPVSFKDYSKKQLARIVLTGAKLPNPQRHFYWMRTFFLGNRNLFSVPSVDLLVSLVPQLDHVKKHSLIGQYIDFYSYMRDDFLVKTDRASMYNSLEVRVPFLDNQIINYAYQEGVDHVTMSKTKIQLRKLLIDTLPDIAKRPKKGFGIPLPEWMRGKLKDFTWSWIDNDKLYNYVDRKEIKNLWDEHQKGQVNNAGSLWQLVVFSGWLKNWA
jgi:asparagine synthase (glutamine-hydrolysing)